MFDENEHEPAYGVASHLKTTGSIGAIPERTFWLAVSAFALGTLPAYITFQYLQSLGGSGLGPLLAHAGVALGVELIPVIVLSPFALWFLDPPVEHGMMRWLAYRVQRKVYQTQDLRSLRDIQVEPDGTIVCRDGLRAILALPTINLDLSSATGKRRHRARVGRFLDGLSSHPFQILIRTHVQSKCTALERMKLHKNPASRQLAEWLSAHYADKQAIDRRRYMVIPAEDRDTLHDRIDSITRSLTQINLEPELLTEEVDVREVLNDWWTWRPHPERIGPEHIRLGTKGLQVDSEFISVYALSKIPNSITTNWWSSLTDGDLAVDVVMTAQQQNLALAKFRLDTRYNNLAASHPSPKRNIALAQIQELRLAFETKVRPWDLQVLFVVRGYDEKTRERYAKRLKQQVSDLGGEIKLLRWEQVQGMESAQPLCGRMLIHRPLYVESGTLARTTPLSASTLRMVDGVPWGLSGSVPILLTTQHMRTGKHFGWFGFTGCIAPETVLQTPDGNFKVSEIKQPFRVWALSETGQPVTAWAETPYIKGTQDLYRVRLHSGREVCVTLQHRFLTPDGWRRLEDVCVGEKIAYAPELPQTSSASYRSSHAGDDLHSEKTPEDFLEHYSGYFRPGDQQLLQEKDNDRAFAQRPSDARVRNQNDSDADDLVISPGHNHAYQAYGRSSKNNFYSLPGHGHAKQFLNAQACSLLLSLSSQNDRQLSAANRPQDTGRLLLEREDPYAYSDAECPSRSNGALDSLTYDSVVSVSFERRDVFYDLHVPRYENYLAEGIWHHNSGKGFGLRCYLARRHFADRLRIFMWDADNATHEYGGRFCSFLKGINIPLLTLKDVDDIELDPAWDVVCFDVSAMPREFQSKAFAKIKLLVEKHVLDFPRETAFVVDEAMKLAEDPVQDGARALGDAVQTWRKYGVECHVVTQRVSDWFGTSIGSKIQGNLSVKWYGAQEDSELADIARKVRWSPEEMDRVASAGIGQGLLVAFGRRVWADLYGHCSPAEFAMYETEPADRVEILPGHSQKAMLLASPTNGHVLTS